MALAGVPKVGGTKDVNPARLLRLAPMHVVVNVDEKRRETAAARRLARDPGHAPLCARRRRRVDRPDGARPDGRPAAAVLYLIWREPWITVARDTDIARLLARVNWRTLPAAEGGDRGAARYPALAGDEPWLADVRELLLASEAYAFGPDHLPLARALCPQARVRLVDGERLGRSGVRTIAGLCAPCARSPTRRNQPSVARPAMAASGASSAGKAFLRPAPRGLRERRNP